MRRILGIAVFVGGLVALSVWAARDAARDIEARIAGQATRIAESSAHDVSVTVSGRDIRVSGVADSPQEKGFLLAALDQIEGRRIVVDDLRVLAAVSPYRLDGVKEPGKAPAISGHVPSDAARALFAGADGGEDLLLASGEPENWLAAATAAVSALGLLDQGEIALVDRALTLSGTAMTDAERQAALASLSDLPDGYARTVTIDVRLSEAQVESRIRDALDALLRDHPEVSGRVSGGEISLEGAVGSTAERERLLSAAGAIDHVTEVRAELSVLRRIAPFTTSAAKPAGGRLVFDGHAPGPAARKTLERYGDAAGLVLGTGAPADWETAARLAAEALAGLSEGRWSLQDGALDFRAAATSGDDKARAEALLSGIPGTIRVSRNITVLDDGKPPAFVVDWTADGGARLSGKLPFGLTPDRIAAALGVPAVTGTPRQAAARDDQAERTVAGLSRIGPWLGQFEKLEVVVDDGVRSVSGVLSPGAILAQVEANLKAELPRARLDLRRATPADLPEDGAIRFNAALGQDERFAGGYWLPVIDDFEATPSGCKARSDDIMRRVRITFVTGEATLSAGSLDDLNRVASVVRRCVRDAGLRATLGGHTDDVGDAAANLALSKARAEAVREALIARGIPPDALTAVGYGETRPVAPNDTEDGRARNRRTTIDWAVGN